MTYLKDGFEYLYEDEAKVYDAIKVINTARRTTNNSQIARFTGISNTRVGQLTLDLATRGFIHNVSKGAAYHWRTTGQPVPYSVTSRKRDRELAARARELNEGIRAQATGADLERIKAEHPDWESPQEQLDRLDPAPHGWEVKTFDGQRLVGIGTFNDETVARDIARGHREHGFTTRVRPAGIYGQIELNVLYGGQAAEGS